MGSPAARQAGALADWYVRRARNLPWRRPDPDPWTVLVSEFLLQQTRVETVLDRFRPIMETIPNPTAAAALDDRALERLWQGMGYYRRARNLRRAAGVIAAHHGGKVPRDPEAVGALPGVGPYTLGAVMAIAFDHPTPGVDGNIARVYGRLHGIEALVKDLKEPAGDWLAALYDHGSPRTLMQAVMDLGATVCTPRRPRCGSCPLAGDCVAATWADPAATPHKPAKRPKPADAVVHAWITDGERVFLAQRGPGLLGERPAPPTLAGPEPPTELADERGRAALVAVGDPYRHTFSHRHWDVVPALYAWDGDGAPGFADAHSEAVGAIGASGLPTAFMKGAGVLAAWEEWLAAAEDTAAYPTASPGAGTRVAPQDHGHDPSRQAMDGRRQAGRSGPGE